MEQHTAGPLQSYRFEDYTAITDPETGAHLARIYHVWPNAEGNLALFKAASQMLKALQTAAAFIEAELDTRKNSFLPNPTEAESAYISGVESALAEIYTAIAAATEITPASASAPKVTLTLNGITTDIKQPEQASTPKAEA